MNFIIKKIAKSISAELPDLLEQYARLNEQQIEQELKNADWRIEIQAETAQISMNTGKLGKLETLLNPVSDQKYRAQKFDVYTPDGKRFPKIDIEKKKMHLLIKLFKGFLPKGLAELVSQYAGMSPDEAEQEVKEAEWDLYTQEDLTLISMCSPKFGKLEIQLTKGIEQKYCTKKISFYTPKSEEFPIYPISTNPAKRIKI